MNYNILYLISATRSISSDEDEIWRRYLPKNLLSSDEESSLEKNLQPHENKYPLNVKKDAKDEICRSELQTEFEKEDSLNSDRSSHHLLHNEIQHFKTDGSKSIQHDYHRKEEKCSRIKDLSLFKFKGDKETPLRMKGYLLHEYESTAFFIEQYPWREIDKDKLCDLGKIKKLLDDLCIHSLKKNNYLVRRNHSKENMKKSLIENILIPLFHLEYTNFLELICFVSAVSFVTGYFVDIKYNNGKTNNNINMFIKNEKFKHYFHVDDLAENLKIFQSEFFNTATCFSFEEYLNYLFYDFPEFRVKDSKILNAFVSNFRKIYLRCYYYIKPSKDIS